MPATVPPGATRSYLFVPGNRPERFAKALASGADALILDLEDSVPAAEKELAREAVTHWLESVAAPLPIWIRVNPASSPWHHDDLQLLLRAGPTGLMLPKCEGAGDLLRFDVSIGEIELAAGRPPGSVQVLVIATESARALQRIHTFDRTLPRLAGILWGAEDLAASLGLRSLRDRQGHYLSPALQARDAALLASHACGVAAIDAVYTGLDDPQGLAEETQAHAALGFTAKAAIHPTQIAVIHQALQPSPDDVAWAAEVIAELENGAKASGRVHGAMVDLPHLKAAQRIQTSLARRRAL